MATIFFNTHDFIKRLIHSGISVDQAEAHATALAEAMRTELMKRSDLNEFRAEVKGQFELLKWMLGFMLAGTVTVLFKIFH